MNVAVKQKVHREFIAVPRLSLPPPEHRAPASGCESSPPTRISWFRSITRERRYARSVKVLALNKASTHSAMKIEEEDRRSGDRKRIPWHASASLALSQPLSLDLASAFQRRRKRIFERRKKEASEGLARVSRRSLWFSKYLNCWNFVKSNGTAMRLFIRKLSKSALSKYVVYFRVECF